MLYSPVENPFHSNDRSDSVDFIGEQWDIYHKGTDALMFFTGFQLEALVAEAQTQGYELADTDSGKGNPEVFDLEPHETEMGCGCYHCHKHYRPSHEGLKGSHDPSEWCHCSSCSLFHEKAEEEKKSAEQAEIWNAIFAKLDAEVDEAKAEEKSRLLDLTDFKAAEEDGDAFNPKKTCRLGDWVRRHLKCPSSGE